MKWELLLNLLSLAVPLTWLYEVIWVKMAHKDQMCCCSEDDHLCG